MLTFSAYQLEYTRGVMRLDRKASDQLLHLAVHFESISHLARLPSNTSESLCLAAACRQVVAERAAPSRATLIALSA